MALIASPAAADDMYLAQSCMSEEQTCFPLVVEDCLSAQNNPVVIPETCWRREHEVWQVVLDQAYSRVLVDTFTAPKSVTQMIRSEQEAWRVHRDLRCAVQSMSNPQTYGTAEAACLARMTYDRAEDVLTRVGADWTSE